MSKNQEQKRIECEQGTIVDIKEGIAFIEASQSASCEACAAKGQCRIGGGSTQQKRLLRAKAGPEFSVGDTVQFAVTAPLLGISFLFYLVPAVLLVTGAVLGNSFFSFFSDSDLNSIIGALCGLVLSVMILFLASRQLTNKSRTTANIVGNTKKNAL